MSADAAVTAYRPARRRAARGVSGRVAAVMTVSLTVSGIALLVLPDDFLALAAPLLANVNIAVLYTTILLFKDRQVPVFEIGSLWVAATLIYASFPFLGFMAGGMNWTPNMDLRLQQYPFVTSEIVWFAWQLTMYFAAFVVAYLLVRRSAAVPVKVFNPIRANTAGALLIVFAALLAVEWGLYFVYGISMNTSHDHAEIMANIARINRLPLLVWQISGHMLEAMTLGEMGVAILLLTQWRKRPWTRVVLVLWLASEVALLVVRGSARSPVVILLLTIGLLYHRLVRPFSVKAVAIGTAAFLTSFVVLGIVRVHSDTPRSINVRTALTNANEFQVLFSTAFDLYQRKQLGTLGTVPWQVRAIDLYLVIPRQLLPFEKIDPSVWYLEVIGFKDSGIGFMFGVLAQSVVGLGWIELVLRGALLGVVFGLLHRWYVKRALRLWPTMLYVFLSIWSFYTFRATSFWFVHFIVFQFIPFLAATKLIEMALQNVRDRPAGKRREIAATA